MTNEDVHNKNNRFTSETTLRLWLSIQSAIFFLLYAVPFTSSQLPYWCGSDLRLKSIDITISYSFPPKTALNLNSHSKMTV